MFANFKAFTSGIGAVVLLCILLALQLDAVLRENAQWHAWVAAGLFLALIPAVYKLAPRAFLMLGLFFIGQLGAVLSCAYIESGNFVVEQMTFGFASGSTIRLVIYNSLFFLVAASLLQRTLQQKDMRQELQPAIAVTTMILIAAIILGLYASLTVTGIPLFMGIDRFAFFSDHPYPLLLTVTGQLYAGALILGILFVRGYPKSAGTLFAAMVVYFVLLSEKYSGLLMLCYMFVLPVAIKRMSAVAWRPALKRLIWPVAVVVGLFAALIGYHYSTINTGLKDNVSEAITNRALGLQGHVWWGIDSELAGESHAGDWDQAIKELAVAAHVARPDNDVGMRYLMGKIAPRHLAQAYYDRDVNFTMGYPAIGLAVGGYWGLVILQILAALGGVLALTYLYKKVTEGNILLAFLAAKICIEVYAALTMGNLHGLSSPKVLLYVVAAGFVELLVRIAGQRRLQEDALVPGRTR